MNAQPPFHIEDEEETGVIQSTIAPNVIWKSTLTLALVSLVLNLILFFVGTGVGWVPEDMPASTEAFSLVSVIVFSVLPVALFGALMVYLANHAPRASRLFTIILTVVLIIAVMVPITLRDIDASFRFVLIAMHIVTAGSILLLTRLPEN